jgi:hypothetical protein
MIGRMPIDCVDHINGIGSDNKWINLREATRSQNMKNRNMTRQSKSGFKGVTKNHNKWSAYARLNGVRVHLGTYDTPEIASQVYQDFAKINHGEFYRE